MTEDNLVASGLAKTPLEAKQLLADKKNLANVQSSFLTTQTGNMAKLIRPGDANNIYALPNVDILKGKAYMAENPFLAKFVAPIAEAGKAEFIPANFLKLGADAIAKGEATTAQVSEGITWMANQLKATNNALNGYKSFGLPEIGAVNMPFTIGTGRILGDISGTIDMTDPVAVNRIVTQVINSTPKATFTERFNDLLDRNQGNPFTGKPLGSTERAPMPGTRIVPYGTPGSNNMAPANTGR